MVGVYASDRIPADGAEMNDTGLASWAGTSFATPVAAGLAACIWSARPELSADEVLAKVVALCRDGNGQRRPLPFVRS
jgi:subtilisin family serine protease